MTFQRGFKVLERVLKSYLTFSAIARDTGLEIPEVSIILAEHDVPVVRVGSANMVCREDYARIKPILAKARKNKLRRAPRSAIA